LSWSTYGAAVAAGVLPPTRSQCAWPGGWASFQPPVVVLVVARSRSSLFWSAPIRCRRSAGVQLGDVPMPAVGGEAQIRRQLTAESFEIGYFGGCCRHFVSPVRRAARESAANSARGPLPRQPWPVQDGRSGGRSSRYGFDRDDWLLGAAGSRLAPLNRVGDLPSPCHWAVAAFAQVVQVGGAGPTVADSRRPRFGRTAWAVWTEPCST
jgi:hypothetical protein